MWVNRQLFDMIVADNKAQATTIQKFYSSDGVITGENAALLAQKGKDDVTIDWMRHRINALEKQNSLMLAKLAGIHVPTPEIVPTRPGTMTPDFDHMPSFEDVGDVEAARLGVSHNPDGSVTYTK